ncbi:hypothetical protein K491DRAFT_688086 [Lophiostoma macrostomum CBS 122681]|uniref:Uncharacterized protein n=1 Tax=Lophiostoma macrostomum CBS 122681 TaxID=1314788 RepID=A0A6A6TMU7_9PLEO|nr:hypothetical protein K491DRAFT_688086 [Lophiostoma macrostomum CBS 122681]
MSSVLRFVWLSWFLEWVAVRGVLGEQRHLYGLSRKKVVGEEERNEWVKGWVRKWDEEKDDWVKNVESTHIEDVVEKPELWHFVDDRVREGESRVVELLRAMEELHGMGRLMAVDFPLTAGIPELHEDDFDPDDDGNSASEHSSHRSGGDVAAESAFQRSTVTFPGVDSIIFQCHRSTLEPSSVSCYIDLIACLVSFVLSQSYERLRLRIDGFRKEAAASDEASFESTTRMFTMLDVHRDTKMFYLQQQAGLSGHGGLEADGPPRTPFYELFKYINKNLAREISWMPQFIERYAEAGGWLVRDRKKLYALLQAQEGKTETDKKHGRARKQVQRRRGGSFDDILTEEERSIMQNIRKIETEIEGERVEMRRDAYQTLRQLEIKKQALDIEIRERKKEVLRGRQKQRVG